MTINALDQILQLPAEDMRSIASQVLGTDAAPVGALTAEKIGRSAGQATVGIYQVTGQANTTTGEKTWRAVVKVLGAPAFPMPGVEVDPYREWAVYRSGELERARAGVRPARCYAVQEQNDLQFLWLEDLSAAPQPPWRAEQFVQTARHVGMFNGHWSEPALPTWEWLHNGGTRTKYWTQRYRQVLEKLDALQTHDIVGPALPSDVVHALVALRHQGEELIVKVESVPRGLCHGDCHPKNLFPVSGLTGEDRTVAVDWSAVGIGPIGFDVGLMLASPIKWMELPLDDAAKLVDPIFNAYLVGLTEAGWSGNEDQVRLTYLTCFGFGEAIRITGILEHLSTHPDPLGIAAFFRVPAEGFFQRWADTLRFFLGYKDEALRLAKRL